MNVLTVKRYEIINDVLKVKYTKKKKKNRHNYEQKTEYVREHTSAARRIIYMIIKNKVINKA